MIFPHHVLSISLGCICANRDTDRMMKLNVLENENELMQ